MPATAPYTNAVETLLADGQWHSIEDIHAIAGPVVPEDDAIRRAHAGRLTGKTCNLVTTGRRMIITRLTGDRRRRGCWESTVINGVQHWRVVQTATPAHAA